MSVKRKPAFAASSAGSAKCGWTTFESGKECGEPASYRWQIPGGAKPVCEHHSREIRAMKLGILTAICGEPFWAAG